MSLEIWCRHFTGIHKKKCEKGIDYMNVRQIQPGISGARFPCSSPEIHHICPLWEPYTQAEIEEHERETADMFTAFMSFMAHKTDICPHCGKQVTRVRQVGRCVYGDPCGCRLWQGSIPDAWRGL